MKGIPKFANSQSLLAFLLLSVSLRTAWPGFSWGISGNVVAASSLLVPLRPPLPAFQVLPAALFRALPVGDAPFRTNLCWIAWSIAAGLMISRLASLLAPSQRSMGALWGLVFWLLRPTWSKMAVSDLAMPSLSLFLASLYCVSTARIPLGFFLLGILSVALPGGLWVAVPLAVLGGWRGRETLLRLGGLSFLGASVALFPVVRGQALQSGVSKVWDWLILPALFGDRKGPFDAMISGLVHSLSVPEILPLLPMAALGLFVLKRRRALVAWPLLALAFSPPGKACMGFRGLAFSALLVILASIAWARLPRLRTLQVLGLFVGIVTLLGRSWFPCSGRDNHWPELFLRDLVSEAPRRSALALERTQTRLLLEGERAASGFRSDLQIHPTSDDKRRPSLVEAVWREDAQVRCRSLGAVRGLLYFSDAALGGLSSGLSSGLSLGLSGEYMAFKKRWIERAQTLSYHKDGEIGRLVVEPILFVAESMWQSKSLWPAAAELEQAVQLAPTHGRARLAYAEALTGLNRDKEAFRQRRLAYMVDPNDPQVARRYGLHLFRIRSFRQAIPVLKKAARFLPDDDAILGDLAASYAAVGDPRKGIRLFEDALALSPENPYIRYNLAFLYYEKGDYAIAVEYADSCIQQGYRTSQSLFMMSRIAMRLGDEKKALENLERAVRLDPSGQIAAAAREDEAFVPIRGDYRFESVTSSLRRLQGSSP